MPFQRVTQWLRTHRAALFRWAEHLLPVGLLALSVGLRFNAPEVYEDIMLRVMDEYQRRRPRVYEDAGVRVIDVDDDSLEKIGQWPWPRTTLAKLVDRLTEAEVAAVAFDAIFSEPDRTSPRRLAEGFSDPVLKEHLRNLPDHDAVFARAIAKGRVVTGYSLVDEDNGVTPELKAGYLVLGDGNPVNWVRRSAGSLRNRPELEKAAAGNGFFNFIPERDGMVRRVPMLLGADAKLMPSLSLEALRVAQNAKTVAIKLTSSGAEKGSNKVKEDIDISRAKTAGQRDPHTGIVELKVGQVVIPTDFAGRAWAYYTADDQSRRISAWKILDPKFDRSQLQGCIVFVGTSAPGLKDLRPTPLDPVAPGVNVHANITEQAVLKKFLVRPDWADGFEIYAMIGLGLILAFFLPRLGAAWCGLIAFSGIGLGAHYSWRAFVEDGRLFDPVYPGATIFIVYFVSSLVKYLRSESERHQVKTAMGRYMSPALVEQLAKHPDKLRLGGETREMTFHFCDIRGFTTISEQLEPKELTGFINSFLTPMTDIILAHKGVIDKYMGDCIMAFWNAPLDDPEHARNACRAALAMHARLRELNARWKKEAEKAGRKYLPIHIGTGLNTGSCIVGNMGSDQRFDYSVLGDDVNLASRLEGQSKTYGVDVIVGPRTREMAPEFAFLELDLIRVKGKNKPVKIYALVGSPEFSAGEEFRAYARAHDEMLAAYRARKWDEALRLMDAAAPGVFDASKLHSIYKERIAAYRQVPPPADWDGSYTATSK